MSAAAPPNFTSALSGIAKLDQPSDYLRWSRKVRLYLELIDCWGVVDESEAKPAENAAVETFKTWEKKDKSAQWAIVSTLETAKAMWDALERRNRKSGASGLYSLLTELVFMKCSDSDDVKQHLQKMKNIAQKLDKIPSSEEVIETVVREADRVA
ncbi:hypothetical protein OIV83_003183 [Microbotryomycetes sp. JL201]|nr:hypothetical protein OIV83_003183 [Microbotryomycetes sp. JL201]